MRNLEDPMIEMQDLLIALHHNTDLRAHQLLQKNHAAMQTTGGINSGEESKILVNAQGGPAIIVSK